MERVSNFLASLVILGGLGYGGYYGYQWANQLLIGTHSAEAVQKAVQPPAIVRKQEKKSIEDGTVIYPDSLKPANGQQFGELIIPKLNTILPIIEGADEEELARGVAHVPETVLPGEPDLTVLSGHRDTVFRHVGELKAGDQLIVKTKKGQFTYKVEKSWIVDANDRSVIHSYKKPYLMLTTCYPFTYIGPAPERYIILARFSPNS